MTETQFKVIVAFAVIGGFAFGAFVIFASRWLDTIRGF